MVLFAIHELYKCCLNINADVMQQLNALINKRYMTTYLFSDITNKKKFSGAVTVRSFTDIPVTHASFILD
jgi:hypothetical protein